MTMIDQTIPKTASAVMIRTANQFSGTTTIQNQVDIGVAIIC
jgi:hypothetical protein